MLLLENARIPQALVLLENAVAKAALRVAHARAAELDVDESERVFPLRTCEILRDVARWERRSVAFIT